MIKHKWRVIIIMAHDGETFFEYNDLEQSILDQKKFENLSYYILYYNQKYDKISIKTPSLEDNIRCLKDISETHRYCCRDFYDKNTLISFLQLVKSMDVQEKDDNEVEHHNLVITWGHGGGLFYFPLGKFEDLLREFGLSLNQNDKTIGSIKSEILRNLSAYVQATGDFSNKEKNSFNRQQFTFLSKEAIKDTMGFTKVMEDDVLDSKLAALNECIADATKFYTATDMNFIFKEGLGYIDVYFALNCFTQMIDTGYELRHSINMMIAPQTTMPLPGINYREVFATLEEKPGIKLRELAKVFVSSFPLKYTDKFKEIIKTHYPKFKLDIVSFSCDFLAEYDLLVKCLNDLTNLIRRIYNDPDLIKYLRKVGDARELCGDLTPDNNYGIIDLNNFVVQLQAQLHAEKPPQVTDVIKEEINAIREKLECVKKFILGDMKKPDLDISKPGFPPNNPSFLSFFAPAFLLGEDGVWRRLLDVYPLIKNEFSRKSDWVGFVNEFYNKTTAS